ncbi:MAG: pantoate--beta-alanine ligase [Deltaproteobacteria bacterium]|nr:pantoate--beta-alanine ligase [Deltaproteobacteria bacterium]
MRIIEEIDEMRECAAKTRSLGLKVVFVPTMGCLHDGHRELLRAAKKSGDLLVLSIFVNPAQFGPKEDFASYPRDMVRDLEIAGDEGADVVFTPKAADMYPEGYSTFVEVGALGDKLCGASRPGHFRGVATVVLKLFNIVTPDTAVFGKKDYQQLLIIRKMARDLDLGLDIIGVETVREPDGLARSSRNRYLSPEEREAARCVPEAIEAAKEAFSAGVNDASLLTGKMKKIIEKQPRAVVDYIKVCDTESLEDLGMIETNGLVALAVKIGPARLIDNCVLEKGAPRRTGAL